ncbi:MAG TPA: hypothetical protein PKN57_12290 [Saprospiraceae bacterium]|nr:endonuclease/exonuclease/phosphatase family protein [Saprospiraceae bacterium]HMX86342.1 hypothetical protein [Saprospiraceae bacterium]HMZ74435.1 hypothetical protein [Saprospiraceae bacterium]HND16002.1 hypothetical protein [Saprospiraceae bacterium]HNE47783.1 hypothetical protein [Saprospiraceae bacterium]
MNLRLIFRNKYVEAITGVFLLLGVFGVILTPDISIIKWTASFALQTTVLYVLAGLFFLTIAQERLLFVSFFCAASLALFLKGNFNPSLKLPEKSFDSTLNIAYLKLAVVDTNKMKLYDVLKYDPDIICLSKPDSIDTSKLFKSIKGNYPYSVRFRGSSMNQVVFSKFPFITADTILLGGDPQALYSIKFSGYKENVYILNTFLRNSIDGTRSTTYQYDLGRLIVMLRPVNSPLIVVGDFDMVSWSGELSYFKKTLGLEDSRRAFYPSLPNLFETPKDHVFYSGQFNCVDFHEFRDINGLHVGLSSEFQMKRDTMDKITQQYNLR